MDKHIMIAGGAGVLGLVGILFVRSRAARQSTTQEQSAAAPLSPILYGPSPISGGISSGDMSSPVPMGSGMESNAMGVSSLDDLMSKFFTNMSIENMARIQTNMYTADTSSLTGLNLGAWGGSADVIHSGNNTTLNIKPGSDPNGVNAGAFIDTEYQSLFGRAPDAAGRNFFLDAYNKGSSLSSIHSALLSSAEYQNKQRSALAAANRPYTETVTNNGNGTVTVTGGKSSA